MEDGHNVEVLQRLSGVRLLRIGEEFEGGGEDCGFLEQGLLEGTMRLEGALRGGYQL